MLSSQWIPGNVPTPQFLDVNESPDRVVRVYLNVGDYVIIRSGEPTLREQPIGTWIYGHRVTQVEIEIGTRTSRQRLYDLMAEIRRIFHSRMHLVTEYQRIQFKDFQELVSENVNVWWGKVNTELINSAVLLET